MALILPLERDVCLRPFTTLKAGGRAELFMECASSDALAEAFLHAHREGLRTTVLGWGSNVLPADDGVEGLVLVNRASRIRIEGQDVEAESGCGFQELFLKTVQAGLGGLEYAVGIPGTVGGALVSNAGAYRSNVSEFITAIEIVFEGRREWVSPDWMGFEYRNSVLRKESAPLAAIISVRFTLPKGEAKSSYDEAREYQRQRISKQPPPASAGSFFKNVYDQALADRLDNLPERLKSAGVVPAGYLIEKAGLKGFRFEGAMLGERHANFILNVGGASSSAIRRLAQLTRKQVFEHFGVALEEEVLYLGDWGRWLRKFGSD